MPDTAYSYAYQRPSAFHEATGRLGLETSGGHALAAPASHPRFFTGFLVHPGAAPAVENGIPDELCGLNRK